MYLLRMISSLLMISILAGCANSLEYDKPVYIKDKRTNLCFVRNVVYTSPNSFVYTNVPCTPEVEKLIIWSFV